MATKDAKAELPQPSENLPGSSAGSSGRAGPEDGFFTRQVKSALYRKFRALLSEGWDGVNATWNDISTKVKSTKDIDKDTVIEDIKAKVVALKEKMQAGFNKILDESGDAGEKIRVMIAAIKENLIVLWDQLCYIAGGICSVFHAIGAVVTWISRVCVAALYRVEEEGSGESVFYPSVCMLHLTVSIYFIAILASLVVVGGWMMGPDVFARVAVRYCLLYFVVEALFLMLEFEGTREKQTSTEVLFYVSMFSAPFLITYMVIACTLFLDSHAGSAMTLFLCFGGKTFFLSYSTFRGEVLSSVRKQIQEIFQRQDLSEYRNTVFLKSLVSSLGLMSLIGFAILVTYFLSHVIYHQLRSAIFLAAFLGSIVKVTACLAPVVFSFMMCNNAVSGRALGGPNSSLGSSRQDQLATVGGSNPEKISVSLDVCYISFLLFHTVSYSALFAIQSGHRFLAATVVNAVFDSFLFIFLLSLLHRLRRVHTSCYSDFLRRQLDVSVSESKPQRDSNIPTNSPRSVSPNRSKTKPGSNEMAAGKSVIIDTFVNFWFVDIFDTFFELPSNQGIDDVDTINPDVSPKSSPAKSAKKGGNPELDVPSPAQETQKDEETLRLFPCGMDEYPCIARDGNFYHTVENVSGMKCLDNVAGQTPSFLLPTTLIGHSVHWEAGDVRGKSVNGKTKSVSKLRGDLLEEELSEMLMYSYSSKMSKSIFCVLMENRILVLSNQLAAMFALFIACYSAYVLDLTPDRGPSFRDISLTDDEGVKHRVTSEGSFNTGSQVISGSNVSFLQEGMQTTTSSFFEDTEYDKVSQFMHKSYIDGESIFHKAAIYLRHYSDEALSSLHKFHPQTVLMTKEDALFNESFTVGPSMWNRFLLAFGLRVVADIIGLHYLDFTSKSVCRLQERRWELRFFRCWSLRCFAALLPISLILVMQA